MPAKLRSYAAKRDFEQTPEPSARPARRRKGPLSFVVQAHAARRMHYDFRLELDGVLLSWAVPKGPSLDPKERRLAVRTEDHPLDYADFEGVIPAGQYGAGSVIVWDRGVWKPDGDPHDGLDAGKLDFVLTGDKLGGRWHLVRTRRKEDKVAPDGTGAEWLLIKGRDARADGAATEAPPKSVLTGRTLEEVAADPDRVWPSDLSQAKLPDASKIEGARKAPMPTSIAPELATAIDAPPKGDGWLYEVKLDGYRVLARLDHGAVELRTRRGKDWSHRMPTLVRALSAWPVDEALIDGEVVVLDRHGVSHFQALQNALGERRDASIVYFAFDLLHLNGRSLTRSPQLARKETLRALLEAVGAHEGHIRYSDHMVGQGQALFEQACGMGLEGVVGKRIDAPYREGRGRDWVKVKCLIREEVLVGGYTDPSGSRSVLGALAVGVHDERGRLRYAGKVGTGFTERSLRSLRRLLEPLETDAPPFVDPPRGAAARGMHWVRPELLVEIEATEITRDGKLRQPSFKGVRMDKSPISPDERVAHERPARRRARPGRGDTDARPKKRASVSSGLRLTHPDRVLYPEDGLTKRDLVEYYARVADRMLPHVTSRLLTLVRCPEGHDGQCFYQRHATRGLPDSVRTMRIPEGKKTGNYIYIQDVEGLLALVQIGALEVHVWGSRVDDLERPDQVVIDLDPDPALPWRRVVEGALRVRAQLEDLGLVSFVKTTGGKGLHVVAPVQRRADWDATKELLKALAEALEREAPKDYVANMSKTKRRGRIYVDYLRNGRAATAIAPYSTRARAGAPVATPVRWEDISTLSATDFTVRSLPALLDAQREDPWEGFFGIRQSITKRARRALGLVA